MIYRELPLKFKNTQKIIVTSCWHVGNPFCRTDKIEEMMKYIRRYKIPWIHLGDIIEAIRPTDKRYHAETQQASITAQLTDAAEYAKIGKNTLIGAIIGNHEDRVSSDTGDITLDFLERVYQDHSKSNYAWLGGACYIKFKCPGGDSTGFFAHSKMSVGGGTSDPDRDKINRQIKIRRNLSPWQADVKVVGHGHRLIIAPPVYDDKLEIQKNKTKLIRKPIKPEWCAMCPSLFGNYDISGKYPSYAEMALYKPTDIGWIVIELGRDGSVLDVKGHVIR